MQNTKTTKAAGQAKSPSNGNQSKSPSNGNQGKSPSNGNQSKKSNGKESKDSDESYTGPISNSQLDKFFHDSIKDIYWAEKHLTKVLPKMRKAATSEELMQAIDTHLEQTEEHVSRLEKVFKLLDKTPQAKKCEAMEGLTKEGESIIEETEDGSATRDVGIIAAAQKVEHYEIATYGTLVQLAAIMGEDEIAEILTQTLEEEKETDELLTNIAENNINWKAEQEGGEAEEED